MLPYWVHGGYGASSWETGHGTFASAVAHIKGIKRGGLATYIILSGRHKGNADGTLYAAYRGRRGLLAMQRHKKLHHLTNRNLLPTSVPD
jgi:hypothetical protein